MTRILGVIGPWQIIIILAAIGILCLIFYYIFKPRQVMKYCPKCKNQVPDESSFCPYCGNQLAQNQSQQYGQAQQYGQSQQYGQAQYGQAQGYYNNQTQGYNQAGGYGQSQQYDGQFQSYGQMQNPNTCPNTYLVFAVLVTIFCCLPFGIVGIVKASNVSKAFISGDYAGAELASKQAKTWCIVGLCCGLVAYIGTIIFTIVSGAAIGSLAAGAMFADF